MVAIGVDVGGSHVTSVLYDGEHIIRRSDVTFVPRSRSTDIVQTIVQSVKAVRQDQDGLPPVGVGIPGIVSSRGIVELAPNLNLCKFDMKAALEAEGVRAHILNDANAAALGEWHAGAGKGSNSLVCVTVGTGIGGGVVMHGRLVTGSAGRAGEIGHMTVLPGGPECSCGARGCLESLSSATAITNRARQAVLDGDPTLLAAAEASGQQLDTIDARMVFRAMRMGSAVARQIIEEAAFWLGVALANVVVMIDPEIIVVGGGVALAGEEFLEPVRRAMKANVVSKIRETPVVGAALGTDAGVIGSAVFAAQNEGLPWR